MATCVKCGAQIPDDAVSCEYCGSARQETNNGNKGSGNRKLIIGLVAAMVVLVAVAAVLVVRLTRGGEEDPATAASSGRTKRVTQNSTEETTQPEVETGTVNRTDASILHNRGSVRTESLMEQDGDADVMRYYNVLELTEVHGSGAERYMQEYADKTNGYEAQILRDMETMTRNMKNRSKDEVRYHVYLSDSLTLYRSDSRVLSYINYRFTPSSNSGGVVALSDYTLENVCIDADSGDTILLTDLVSDTERLSERAVDALYEKYDLSELTDDGSEPDRDTLREEIQNLMEGKAMNSGMYFGYAPTYYGLTLVFETGNLLPESDRIYYGDSFLQVIIPYYSEPDLFASYYTDLPESFVVEMEEGTEYEMETDDGTVTLRVEPVYTESNNSRYMSGGVKVTLDGKTETLTEFDKTLSNTYTGEVYLSDVTGWLVRDKGAYYLWVQYEESTAIGYWAQLHAYEIGAGSCRHLGVTADTIGYANPPQDPAHFRLERSFFIMRHGDSMDTYSVFDATCKDGMPVRGTDSYKLTDEYGLVATTDLYIKDAESGEEVYLPKGITVYRTETDAETYVILSAPEHGISVRLDLVDGDVEDVGGMSWYDAFSPGWETGAYDTNATAASFEEILAEYRRVLPTYTNDSYEDVDYESFAGDLFVWYTGMWDEINRNGDVLETFSYAFTDLNGDGTDEMLIANVSDGYATVHQLFAIGKNDGKVRLITSAGYRAYMWVNTDNTIVSGGSGGAAIFSHYIYRLNANADDLEFVEGIYFDAFEDEENPYFAATDTGQTDEYGYSIMDFTPITEAETDAMIGKYKEKDLQWFAIGE